MNDRATPAPLPLRTRAAMFVRMLAIQSSWNYETLVGNGIGFSVEPALRGLPGGVDGEAYHAALARESRYFNAHPYLAAVAVGALARAELDGESPERIERFRSALCGPLGSVGDRLVWASLLPACSLAALGVFGLGGGALAVALTFFVLYNVGHVALRLWGLRVGLRHGIRVAASLGAPFLRAGPNRIGQVACLVAGFALPLAVERIVDTSRTEFGGALLVVAAGAGLLARWHGRVEGWKVAGVLLAAFVLFSVAR